MLHSRAFTIVTVQYSMLGAALCTYSGKFSRIQSSQRTLLTNFYRKKTIYSVLCLLVHRLSKCLLSYGHVLLCVTHFKMYSHTKSTFKALMVLMTLSWSCSSERFSCFHRRFFLYYLLFHHYFLNCIIVGSWYSMF